MLQLSIALFMIITLGGQLLAADLGATIQVDDEPVLDVTDNVRGMKFRPSISISSGYDSNYDKSSSAEGSAFVRSDLGLEISYETENGNIFTTEASAKLVDLIDLEDPERWEYTLDFNGDIGLAGDDLRLIYGGEHYYDATDPPVPVVSNYGFVKVVKKNEQLKMSLRGSIEQEYAISNDILDKEFDYLKGEAELSVRANNDGVILPYMKIRAAKVHFPEQDINLSLIDRNSNDYSLKAGVRLNFKDNLRLKIGGLYNFRQFETGTRGEYGSAYVDAKLSWEPTDEQSFEAKVERYLAETTTYDSLVTDITKYKITSIYDVNDDVSFRSSVEYNINDEIGIDDTKREQVYKVEARYEPSDSIRLFANFLYGRSTETVSEGYERFRVQSGLRLKM